MEFTAWLTQHGFDPATLSDGQKAVLKAQWAAQHPPADDPPPKNPHGAGFEAELAEQRKERERISRIEAVARKAIEAYPTQFETIERVVQAANADQNCDETRFELNLLREMRPGSIDTRHRPSEEVGTKVVEAAICRSLGMRSLEKQFDERTLEAADKSFRHGVGLQQLLFKAAAANGEHYDSAHNVRGLLQAAFVGPMQASGFSTFSLPGILSNVMNKLLLDHFNHVDAAWRQISAVRPVRDFRQVESYTLTGDLEYEQIGPAGEIKHGTLGEEKYTNKADTYARMLAITRTDIINDDLGAFQRVPQRLGRGGALKICDVFWRKFLGNADFFKSGNNNVSTGGGSALGTADGAAIGAAELVFLNQKDPDGKPLGVTPRIMLVPPTLLNTAVRWMGGQLIVTGDDTTLPNVNVYQGRYLVVSSPYMENASYTGFSAAAWYLLADPMDLPVIETVFLNGRDVPVVESADADFNTLGIQVRAYHDFGCALQEPRGGVRSAGT